MFVLRDRIVAHYQRGYKESKLRQETNLDRFQALTFIPVIAAYSTGPKEAHQICIFFHRTSTDDQWDALCCDPNYPHPRMHEATKAKVQEVALKIVQQPVRGLYSACVNVNMMQFCRYSNAQGICTQAFPLILLGAQLAFADRRRESPVMDANMLIRLIREGSRVLRAHPDLVYDLLRRNQPLIVWQRLLAGELLKARLRPDLPLVSKPQVWPPARSEYRSPGPSGLSLLPAGSSRRARSRSRSRAGPA